MPNVAGAKRAAPPSRTALVDRDVHDQDGPAGAGLAGPDGLDREAVRALVSGLGLYSKDVRSSILTVPCFGCVMIFELVTMPSRLKA